MDVETQGILLSMQYWTNPNIEIISYWRAFEIATSQSRLVYH